MKMRVQWMLVLLSLLGMTLPAMADQWVKHNYLWTCKGEASLLIPGLFKVSQNADGLLSLEDKTQNCYVGFALAENIKEADRFLTVLHHRFKNTGPLKLALTNRYHPAHSHRFEVIRDGQTIIDKVPMYIAIGYLTNKKKYLAFLILYPVARKNVYWDAVLNIVASARFK